jgi:hypothetical protein
LNRPGMNSKLHNSKRFIRLFKKQVAIFGIYLYSVTTEW